MGVSLDSVRRLVRPAAHAGAAAAAQVADDGVAAAARTGPRSPLRRGPLAIGIVGAGLLTAGCATATRRSPIDDARDAGIEEIQRRAEQHRNTMTTPVASRELLPLGRIWNTGEDLVDKHLPLGPAVSPEWFGVQGLVGDPFGYSYLEEADAVASAAIGTQLDGSVNVVLQHPIRRRYWVVQADRLTSLGQTPNPRIVPGAAVVERIYAR